MKEITRDKNYTFRQLNQNDVEEFNDLLSYAFQVTSSELKDSGWEDKDDIKRSKRPIFEFSYVLGCFYNGKPDCNLSDGSEYSGRNISDGRSDWRDDLSGIYGAWAFSCAY